MTISATKPTLSPVWATDALTRVEPSAGQKATGWTNGQRPAHNVMNWLQGIIYDWQQYLEDATDQLESTKLNRSGDQTMQGDIIPDGNNTRDLGSAAVRWAIIAGQLVAVYDSLFLDSGARVTTDMLPSGSGVRTLGAVGNLWNLKASVIDAVDVNVDNLVSGDAEVLSLTSTNGVFCHGLTVLPTTADEQTQRNQRNNVQARCSFVPGAVPTLSATDKWNVASVAQNGGAGKYTVTFTRSIGAGAAVNVSIDQGGVPSAGDAQTISYHWTSTTTLDIYVLTGNPTAYADPDFISVSVIGQGFTLV